MKSSESQEPSDQVKTEEAVDVWTLRGNPFRDAHFVIPTLWKGHFVMDISCDPFRVTHFVERTLRGWTLRGTMIKKKGISRSNPPSPILKIYIPFVFSSLTDNISAKIFLRSRLVRALGRLKVF